MIRRKTLQGFTLIEVLIAMTMLSIMVVLLFASLRICADSWEKGESKIADVNEVAVVYSFFQRYLSAAIPLQNDVSVEDNALEDNAFSFQGGQQSLQFVSSFPASAGKTGLQLFSIDLLEEDDERFIKVTLTPFFPAAKDEELQKEEVTLVRHVEAVSFAYFGDDGGSGEEIWQNEWLQKNIMPRLVKINIELENGIYWPEMMIDLKIIGLHTNSDLETQDSADVAEEEQ